MLALKKEEDLLEKKTLRRFLLHKRITMAIVSPLRYYGRAENKFTTNDHFSFLSFFF